jgi:hypothetical protein
VRCYNRRASNERRQRRPDWAEACQANNAEILLPFGTVNPALPDWEEDLRRCQEKYRMPGIRLYPSYHNYTLQTPEVARLCSWPRSAA